MSATLLRIELRRGLSARLAVLLVILLGLAFVEALSFGAVPTWAITPLAFLGTALPFVQALVLAVAAWEGGRERRLGMAELVGSTPRPRMQRVSAAWLPTAAWPVLAYLPVIAAFGVLSARAASGPPLFGTVAATEATLVACAALGFAVGRYVPGRFTAPVSGVAVAVGVGAAALWAPHGLVNTVPSQIFGGSAGLASWSDVTLWDRPVWWFAPVATIWFLALATALLVGAAARRRWWAVMPVVVAALAVVPLVRAPVWRVDTASPLLACSAGTVQVCIPDAAGLPLRPVATSTREVRVRLASVPGIPRAYLWPLRSCMTAADTLTCSADHLSPSAAGSSLAAQVTTWKCLGSDVPEYPASGLQAGARAWLLGRTGSASPPVARRLAALDPHQQQAWMGRYLRAADACDSVSIAQLRLR